VSCCAGVDCVGMVSKPLASVVDPHLTHAAPPTLLQTAPSPQLASAWLLAQLLTADAAAPPPCSTRDLPPPSSATAQGAAQPQGPLALPVFHPAAGDAVLQAALWRETPPAAPMPNRGSNTAEGQAARRPAGGFTPVAASSVPRQPAASSNRSSTASSSGSGPTASWLPREVLLPCAGALGVPQLLATFVGLWHATMRMQQLGYASQADR
jgi:hypothetical protein